VEPFEAVFLCECVTQIGISYGYVEGIGVVDNVDEVEKFRCACAQIEFVGECVAVMVGAVIGLGEVIGQQAVIAAVREEK
jgi:hypothetical protein